MRQNAAFGLRGTAHGRIRPSESGPGPTRSDLIHWPLHARPGVAPIRLDEPEGPTFRMAARHWLCPGVLPEVYEPRSPAGTGLPPSLRTPLPPLLPETAAASGGAGGARLIAPEVRDLLGCGAA